MDRIIETDKPRVALVIATFAGVPYVHLALEAWRRQCRDLPVLVHDDGSPRTPELRMLARQYGAAFHSNPRRMRPTIGDLSAYPHGMDWAAGLGADLLVKMSRRFIPLLNWVPGLQQLAWSTQYATYSQRCRHFDFGFRTECVGFHLRSWRDGPVMGRLREAVARDEPVFVEGLLHDMARELHRDACTVTRQFEAAFPRHPDTDAYGVWDFMPDQRTTRAPQLLWHDSDEPLDYARIALAFGLPYRTGDFADPNQGHGLGA